MQIHGTVGGGQYSEFCLSLRIPVLLEIVPEAVIADGRTSEGFLSPSRDVPATQSHQGGKSSH